MQRIMRLTVALQQLGLALGGKAGVRLGATRYVPTSPDTLLRLVRQLPEPPMVTPTILGVDNWAMRRGHTYGTLLIDLERHRPLDLLPDRTAETLATWHRGHSGVHIPSRDHSTESPRGATLGAPEVQHVLDRELLVRNLHTALEQLVDRLHHPLAARLTARQVAAARTSSVNARAPPLYR